MYKRQCFYLNTTAVANSNPDADAEMLMLRFPNCRVNPFVPNPPFLYLFSGGTERCIGSKWVKINITYNGMSVLSQIGSNIWTVYILLGFVHWSCFIHFREYEVCWANCSAVFWRRRRFVGRFFSSNLM